MSFIIWWYSLGEVGKRDHIKMNILETIGDTLCVERRPGKKDGPDVKYWGYFSFEATPLQVSVTLS